LNPQDSLPSGENNLQGWPGDKPVIKTDAEGKFTVTGLGAERLVLLEFTGGGISHMGAAVVTRKGFDPKRYNEAVAANAILPIQLKYQELLFGPDLAIVAEPEKPIRGTVTDAVTGKPLAGVSVCLTRYDNMLHLAGRSTMSMLCGVSDARGRYAIRGARKMTRYMVEVYSDAKTGYLAGGAWADDTDGYKDVTVGVRLVKGVIIRGRIIDKSTRKPVLGSVWVAALRDNPFARKFPPFEDSASLHSERSKEDGTFRVVALPGPVLLMGGPDTRSYINGIGAWYAYKPSVPDPGYPNYFYYNKQFRGFGYLGTRTSFRALEGNFCKVLQLKPNAGEVVQDIELQPAHAVQVALRDAAGKPLTGVWATGFSHHEGAGPQVCETDLCPAYEIETDKPRRMFVYDPKRKLAGSTTVRHDAKQPVVVTLRPTGSLKGRLVDGDGKPLAGVRVTHGFDSTANGVHRWIYRTKLVETDAHGAFTLDDVLPGIPFGLYFRQGKNWYEPTKAEAEKTFQVKPGETADLGKLVRMRASKSPGE
jgi:hypothetical protein